MTHRAEFTVTLRLDKLPDDEDFSALETEIKERLLSGVSSTVPPSTFEVLSVDVQALWKDKAE